MGPQFPCGRQENLPGSSLEPVHGMRLVNVRWTLRAIKTSADGWESSIELICKKQLNNVQKKMCRSDTDTG